MRFPGGGSPTWQLASSRGSDPGERTRRKLHCLYGLVLGTHSRTYHTLLIRTESLSPATFKERGISLHLWNQGCVDILNPLQLFFLVSLCNVCFCLMAKTDRKKVVKPMSPAEALFLFDPPDIVVSRQCPGSSHAPNNWDSDQSPEPVWNGIQGGTKHPDLGHMPTSEDEVNPS